MRPTSLPRATGEVLLASSCLLDLAAQRLPGAPGSWVAHGTKEAVWLNLESLLQGAEVKGQIDMPLRGFLPALLISKISSWASGHVSL